MILGKRGHAEVVGLTGQVQAPTIVIEGEKRPRPDRLYAAGLFPVADDPEHRPVRGPGCRDAPPGSIRTGCGSTTRSAGRYRTANNTWRNSHAASTWWCSSVGASRRTARYSRRCAAGRTPGHTIEEAAEIDPAWFPGAESVGICGATSTPKWLMQEVADRIGQVGRR